MLCNFQEYLSYDYHNTYASNMLQKKKQGWMHNWCIQLPNYKARFLLLIKWQAQWSSDVPKEIGRGHSDTDYSMQPSTYSSKYKWEIAVTCFSIKDGTQSQKLAKQNLDMYRWHSTPYVKHPHLNFISSSLTLLHNNNKIELQYPWTLA